MARLNRQVAGVRYLSLKNTWFHGVGGSTFTTAGMTTDLAQTRATVTSDNQLAA
jgi:hypothetical protein